MHPPKNETPPGPERPTAIEVNRTEAGDYRAEVRGEPGCFAVAGSVAEAITALVLNFPERFGVRSLDRQ
jgi:hypothetical protein